MSKCSELELTVMSLIAHEEHGSASANTHDHFAAVCGLSIRVEPSDAIRFTGPACSGLLKRVVPPDLSDAIMRRAWQRAHDENAGRLDLIRRLWGELKAAEKGSPRYKELVEHIRREADAFRRTLDTHDAEGAE